MTNVRAAVFNVNLSLSNYKSEVKRVFNVFNVFNVSSLFCNEYLQHRQKAISKENFKTLLLGETS